MTDTTEFDHHSPEYAARWPEIYASLHQHNVSVVRTAAHGGAFVVASYDAVEQVIKDDATFSSRHDLEDPESPYGGIAQPPSAIRTTPIELDPPEFAYFRKALNPYFSPGAARRWEPWLRQVATALIDDVIEDGHMDVVDALASPLPALLTAKMLGLPLDEWRIYSDAAHGIVAYPAGSAELEAAHQQFGAVLGKAFETAAKRRVEPDDDLISLFVQLQEDGLPLSDMRVIEMTALMIAGGNDTTTSLMSGALALLADRPEWWEWLAQDPSRLDRACEEFLRMLTPTQTLARTVTCPASVGGLQLAEGDRVVIALAGANRDPRVFEDPDACDLSRFPNRHQAFGLGIHRCIGSNLTRVQFRVVFEELLRRTPDLEVDREACVAYDSAGHVNGWHRVPATFTPGTREGEGLKL